MQKAMGVFAFLVFVSVFTIVTERQNVTADEIKADSSAVVAVKVYRVHDLAVWTAEKKFEPSVIMRLIEATVSPSEWEAKGGSSTMAPYWPNASLVITTQIRNHDKIKALLKSMRPAEAAK